MLCKSLRTAHFGEKVIHNTCLHGRGWAHRTRCVLQVDLVVLYIYEGHWVVLGR